MSAPKRGRPATGQALSGAERQRRYQARLKAGQMALNFVTDGKSTGPDAFFVTDGNPEHQALFAIPTPQPSASTALAVRVLPEQRRVTGDLETDAFIWLREVCKTATDLSTLDVALEAAQRIQTPAKQIEDRYADWLRRQPGANVFSAMSAFDVADIERHAKSARERITINAEGMAVFGSYEGAMRDTPAEQMLERLAGPLPDFHPLQFLKQGELAEIFADTVNPESLTEAVAEIRYWNWLSQIRWKMSATAHPGSYSPDPSALVDARTQFAEGLLQVLAPVDLAEAVYLADQLKAGLIDIGSVDDGERRAEILDHLLRSLP